jgi:hypothetical protein
MKGSIFPGEKWCFFMCAIAEGKTIELLPQIDTKYITEKILPVSENAQIGKLAKSQNHLRAVLATS